jgi:hypothetical protein
VESSDVKTTEADATRRRRLALVRRSNAALVTANDVVVVSFSFFFFLLEKEGKYHIMHVQLALLVHPQQTAVRVFVMCALLPLFSFLFDVVPFL